MNGMVRFIFAIRKTKGISATEKAEDKAVSYWEFVLKKKKRAREKLNNKRWHWESRFIQTQKGEGFRSAYRFVSFYGHFWNIVIVPLHPTDNFCWGFCPYLFFSKKQILSFTKKIVYIVCFLLQQLVFYFFKNYFY